MKLLTNLIFKVSLSSMILTAPAMVSKNYNVSGNEGLARKVFLLPYYSSVVIKRFVNYNNLTATAIYNADKPIASPLRPVAPENKHDEREPFNTMKEGALDNTLKESALTNAGKESALSNTFKAAAKAAELKMVINEAVILYNEMDLEDEGLNEKAFEYAWRGYHNLVKRGLVRKKNVLSICDFSQSSCSKRLYVIDIAHKKLLYRTFVAHGQNSGGEYAESFSNEPESFKSSLGFYVTSGTYFGHNGLSLRINGVDTGYNDKANKRNIVLHGSSYVSLKYMEDNGTLGTSRGCPAIPAAMSPLIIRAVKHGSCIFIYHPTPKYLEESTVING